MWNKAALGLIALAALLAGCEPQQDKPYTGKLRIDAGTEYQMVDEPSSIGGACSGWNVVSVQKPGDPSSGMRDLLCWKRDGDNITVSDQTGLHQNTSPARLLTD